MKRKIISLVMAIVLCMSIAIPARAAQKTISFGYFDVTIRNLVKETTVSINHGWGGKISLESVVVYWIPASGSEVVYSNAVITDENTGGPPVMFIGYTRGNDGYYYDTSSIGADFDVLSDGSLGKIIVPGNLAYESSSLGIDLLDGSTIFSINGVYFAFADEPKSQTAKPTASSVSVNGSLKAFDAYNIGGANYFKLRDLAVVLNGTEKQFEVGYDNATKAITLTSGKPYTANNSEMVQGDGKAKNAVPTPSTIYLNGKVLDLVVYNIGGANFFKLRDLMEALDVYVGYDNATKAITLDTSKGYAAG